MEKTDYNDILLRVSRMFPTKDLNVLEQIVSYVHDTIYDTAFNNGYETALKDIEAKKIMTNAQLDDSRVAQEKS